MIDLRNFIIPCICIFFISCDSGKKEETTSQAPESLIGTWKLQKRINHQNNETEWSEVSGSIIYDKYLTDTHFTWIQYDTENDALIGTGGGKYDYEDGKYIEHIEFFMPPTGGILGQSIYFNAEFKEGNWYHTGYTKTIEFDPESAKMVETDSNKVEEIWARVENENASDIILGTWELQELKSSADAPAFSYPDFINYIKLITPTHFIWIQYNDDGDEVTGAGSGTYTYSGNEYRETIQMMYPSGNVLTGGEVIFKCDIDGNRWSHNCIAVEKNGVSSDTIYIDEKWAKVGSI